MENTGQSSLDNIHKKGKEKDDPAKFLRPSQSDSQKDQQSELEREQIEAKAVQELTLSQTSLTNAQIMRNRAERIWKQTQKSITAAKASRREARLESGSDIRDERKWNAKKNDAALMLKAANSWRDEAEKQRSAALDGKHLAAQSNQRVNKDALASNLASDVKSLLGTASNTWQEAGRTYRSAFLVWHTVMGLTDKLVTRWERAGDAWQATLKGSRMRVKTRMMNNLPTLKISTKSNLPL